MRRPARLRSISTALVLAVVGGGGVAYGQTVGRVIQGSLLSDSNSIPPDTMGAVGIDHYVETLNGRVSVYRKSDGVRVSTATLTGFFQNVGLTLASNRAFDPRVVYDPNSRRFIAAGLDGSSTAGNNAFLIAASRTSDPTTLSSGGYTAVRVPVNASRFTDFDMLGLNGTHVTVTGNGFVPSGGGANTAFYSIPKSSLFAGNTTNATLVGNADFNNTGFTPHAVFDYNGSTGIQDVLSAYNSGNLAVSTLTTTGANSTATLTGPVFVSVPTWTGPSSGRQPTVVSPLIDNGDERFSGGVIRQGNNIWAVHTVRGTNNNNAIRWYRINALNLTLAESGLIEDTAFDYSYGSISVNPAGNLMVGFSRMGPASPAGFPSAVAVAGTLSGGTTTFGTPVVLRAGTASYAVTFGGGRNRWGDYSATTLDPTDPQIFWTSQEYANASNSWGVVHGELIIPAPGEARWSNAASGSYASTSSFLGGTLPAATDTFVLSRATTPGAAAYTVSMTGSNAVARLSSRQGNAAVALGGGTLTLGDASAAGSLVVGEFGGTPTLTFSGGTLATVSTLVAPSAVSTGTLVVSGATWNNAAGVTLGTTNSPAGSTAGPLGTASLTLDNAATGTFVGLLTVRPNGTVTLTGTNTRLNASVANAGRVTINAGATLSAASVTTSGTVTVSGTVSGPGAVTGLTVAAGGSVVLVGPAPAVAVGTLAVANDGAALGTRAYLGRVDLTTRDLVVQAGSVAELRDGVRAFLANGGTAGIGSSLGGSLTTVAVFPNALVTAGGTVSYFDTYEGTGLTPASVILKYTYVGDTDLSGTLTGADLARIIEGITTGRKGWEWGDTNYDGVVNATDLAAFQVAFAGQGAPLGWAGETTGGSVPEPGALLAGAVVGGLVRRRRRGAVR